MSGRAEMIAEYDLTFPLTSQPGKLSAHKPNTVLKFPTNSLSPEEMITTYDLAFPLTSAPGKISVPEETEDIQKRAA